jgi:hypothetical protein
LLKNRQGKLLKPRKKKQQEKQNWSGRNSLLPKLLPNARLNWKDKQRRHVRMN